MNPKKRLSQKKPPSSVLSWTELHKTINTLHQKGVEGDRNSIREAYRILEQARNDFSDNNLVLAYLGSILCLIGRDRTEPVERSANVMRGLKLLDQAVANEPDNIEIRIIRGNVGVNLPEMYFHRNAGAIEDCTYILSCYEQNPDDIPVGLYFQFLYNLSIAYRNLGENEKSEAAIKKLCDELQDPRYRMLLNPQNSSGSHQGMNNFQILMQPLSVILKEGDRLHQAALNGGKTDLHRAVDFYAKALALHPDNRLLKAYQADCMSLQAKYASNTGEMFAGAIKAMKEIDAAVVGEPENIILRLIRANHSMRLPEAFFARTATAIADLEYLADMLRQNPGLFEKTQSELILFNLGTCYFRLGLNSEGEEIWRQLLAAPELTGELREKILRHYQNQVTPAIDPNLSLIKDPGKYYDAAKRFHGLGVSGNKAAAEIALQLWEKAYTAEPANPEAEGYYGSSLALIATDTSEINTMFGNAIKGLKHLNNALDRAPDNWELHLLRGYLSYSLPEVFFHTTRQAIQDFEFLINAFKQDNHLFSRELFSRIELDLEKAKCRME